jgi:hypothetical protein
MTSVSSDRAAPASASEFVRSGQRRGLASPSSANWPPPEVGNFRALGPRIATLLLRKILLYREEHDGMNQIESVTASSEIGERSCRQNGREPVTIEYEQKENQRHDGPAEPTRHRHRQVQRDIGSPVVGDESGSLNPFKLVEAGD